MRIIAGNTYRNPRGRWIKIMCSDGNRINYNTSGCVQSPRGTKVASRQGFIDSLLQGKYVKTNEQSPFTI